MSEWGTFHDPDTHNGVAAYTEAGMRLLAPDEIRALGATGMYEVALGCGEILDEVYGGNYPLRAADAEQLAYDMAIGEKHVFALYRDERMVAMAGLTMHANKLGGDVRVAELGMAASRQDHDGAHIPMRPMLKHRVPWAVENLPSTDFLVSSTRAAAHDNNGSPSGKGVQSVWWGSRRHGAQIPFVTTGGSWDYKINGIEPLNGFAIPTDPDRWIGIASALPVYVATEADKDVLDTLLIEGTNGRLAPQVVIAPTTEGVADFDFKQTSPPAEVAAAKYVITNVETKLFAHDGAEVDMQLADSISQKVVVEFDVASSPQGTQVMRQLHEQGWTLAGWQPSELVYGGICPVFARLNPGMLAEVVEPGHHPEYFDDGGLPGTRRVLESMYSNMFATAEQAHLKQKALVR